MVVVTARGDRLPPRRRQASYARVPLIVVRPTATELARPRGRPDDRSGRAVRLAVRWFCELGNIDADDDGLLHLPTRPTAAPWRRPRPDAPGPCV